ncbi:MAG: TolC family protein [Gemmataceae bacterium]
MYRIRSLLGGLVLPGVLTVCARADEAPVLVLPPPPAAVTVAPPAPVTLTFEAARTTAADRQTGVSVAVASLHAAITRRDAINSLRVPTFLARDLPIRKHQSDLGVSAADAALQLARLNASYGATYSYLSYLYALEQEKVAAEAIVNLNKLREKVLAPDEAEQRVASGLVRQEKGDKDAEKKDPEKKAGKLKDPNRLSPEKWVEYLSIETYQGIARTRREEAAAGAERALSALREAMGLPPDAALNLARCRLPDLCLTLDKRILLDLAASRRPELTQAALGLDVANLETAAQTQQRFLAFRANTFASGSDLHSTPLPAGSFDNEYKPGAAGPEYPAMINGGKKAREAQAEAWASRAGTLVERTRGLIALETEQAFLRWVDATKRLAGYREAFQTAHKRVREYRRIAEANEGLDVPSILSSGAIASQMRADLNKARYEALLALAQIERVTAGGFCARLDGAADAPDEVAAADAAYEAAQKARKDAEEAEKKAKEKDEKEEKDKGGKDKKDDATRTEVEQR